MRLPMNATSLVLFWAVVEKGRKTGLGQRSSLVLFTY